MDKQIIFEDEHIRVIFLKGSSDTLVISFGDLISRAKGMSINAEKSLIKYQYNVIGIMPKQKSWFPKSSMLQMQQQIQPILQQFKGIVGYGGSMGGYAAIKYSNLLDMQKIVAFVPQFSIDPDVVEDRRYAEFFDASIHQDMQIQADEVDSSREYIIVYDPYYAEDKEHFLKIQPLLPNMHVIHLPFTGHEALSVLASSQLLNDFVVKPFEITYFYQRVREVKKQSKFYYRHVLDALLPRHHQALLKILQQNDIALDERYFDAVLKQKLVQQLFNLKQGTEQNLYKLGVHLHFVQHTETQAANVVNAQNQFLVFNLASLKLECYSTEIIAANSAYLLPLNLTANSLVKLRLNDEYYFLTMNDRGIHKLVKEGEPFALDQSPLVFKHYADFYSLSYKQLSLCCDAQGLTHFIENNADEQTKLQLC
ncbi:hypothetical protein [Acinetobacter gyllenbergii]|uniref:Alpha/beta hydrolase n=1 Tax=Acinetobacter gyllenbergii CIP 110306 = MTCC 11365 TaxID=1217657 RepID=A0A829HPB0_9GAMM|nr:hypothetical protein [Acinetobacter gyllenbergii]EPF93114.1 hypothetical protein F957_00460 [Acinetobacter gyllenbergii CIP 110306 = MTCC 11365]ESK36786.1 hypothetical protein F987_03599 [Acinetobacter gyllenbergii NIPH 230]